MLFVICLALIGLIIRDIRNGRVVKQEQPTPKEQPSPQKEFRGYCVYAIANNKRLYIGMTGSYNRRMKQHFDPEHRAKENKYLYNCMKPHNINNFKKFPLIQGLSKEESLYIEARLIKDWGTLKPYGFNIADEQDGRDLGYDISVDNPELFAFIKRYKQMHVKHNVIKHQYKVRVYRNEDKVTISHPINLFKKEKE